MPASHRIYSLICELNVHAVASLAANEHTFPAPAIQTNIEQFIRAICSIFLFSILFSLRFDSIQEQTA